VTPSPGSLGKTTVAPINTSPVVLSLIVPDIETLRCDCDHEAKGEIKKSNVAIWLIHLIVKLLEV